MFKQPEQKPTIAEEVRDEKIQKLRDLDPGTNEYKATLETVKALDDVHTSNRSETSPSPDVIVKACAMVVAVVIVVAFEKSNVWTTKVTSFMPKFL